MPKWHLLFLSLGALLYTGCDNKSHTTSESLPQKPYKSWRLGGRFPNDFQADIINTNVKTQSNQIGHASIAIGSDQNDDRTQWHVPRGWPHALNTGGDLPEEIYICWVSFVDQTFYKTKIVVPLEIRKQMVIPFLDLYHVPGTDRIEKHIDYLDTIIIGFGPGGNVIAWLNGVVRKDGIEFAIGETERLGSNSHECLNPYRHGKIPEVEDEVKAWLKKHGMPKQWQEKPSVYETPSWKKVKSDPIASLYSGTVP